MIYRDDILPSDLSTEDWLEISQDPINFTYEGYDAAHCGPSDFYEAFEQALIESLQSGEPFCTGWWSVKKELVTFCITRGREKCWVKVSQAMDSALDGLIDTAIWAAAKKHGREPACGYDWLEKNGYHAQAEVHEIFNGYLEGQDEFYEEAELCCDPTMEGIVEALEKANELTDEALKDIYDRLVDYMEYRYFENEENECTS
jgi:hypothetical protein